MPARWITVYCSSSEHVDPSYREAAEAIGQGLAARGWGLVYGGARVGLMGSVSRAARAAGAPVKGVILRRFVDKNVHCTETADMATVDDMPARKAGLQQGDGFLALPGGYGTFEELFEVLAWRQIGIHAKPIVVLDTNGYWRPILDMVERAVVEGFVRQEHADLMQVAPTPDAALDLLARAFGDATA